MLDDDASRQALRLRMLQIDAAVWRETIADYERLIARGDASEPPGVDLRLVALAEAYARHSPHAVPLSAPPEVRSCPLCLEGSVTALLARRPGPLVYGRCSSCGHGALMSGFPGVESVYAADDYYVRRTDAGVGYDHYEAERVYRETKAGALLDRIERTVRATGSRLQTLLEVGSGFGFTRAVAEHRGISTLGVDVNPEAARATERIYGLSTFTGTLTAALADPTAGVRLGASDLVVYQFVLEHIADPVDELRAAVRALRPRGFIALLVPNMEAKELDVFGASYRSLRADHLHLFSRRSLGLALERAGFEPLLVETGASVDLLRGFLSEDELRSLYDAGCGPDLFALAKTIG